MKLVSAPYEDSQLDGICSEGIHRILGKDSSGLTFFEKYRKILGSHSARRRRLPTDQGQTVLILYAQATPQPLLKNYALHIPSLGFISGVAISKTLDDLLGNQKCYVPR